MTKKTLLIIFIVALFLTPQPTYSATKELDGRVAETDLSDTAASQDSTTSTNSHQLPSWFGANDATSQQTTASTSSNQLPSWFGANDSAQPTTAAPQSRTVVELKSQPALDDSYKPSTASRPDWIPLHAYTNDNMICLYGSIVPWLSLGLPISPLGEQVRMFKSVSQYWGDGHYGSCMIWCNPVPGHPGNFCFCTIGNRNGPRGWLQDMKESRKGRRLYRYWFDQ